MNYVNSLIHLIKFFLTDLGPVTIRHWNFMRFQFSLLLELAPLVESLLSSKVWAAVTEVHFESASIFNTVTFL